MTYAKATLKYLFLAVLALMCSGCISMAVERTTNRHRDVFTYQHTQSDIRKKVGKPVESWDRNSRHAPAFDPGDALAYDVFKVRGVIARPGDGAAQATANAITLGVGEVFLLPMTLAGVATKPLTIQWVVVFYDENLRYQRHRIYDRHGDTVDTLGY